MALDESHIAALISAAKSARENAYAPYSNFRVGAAVLTSSNKVYLGCNVENASYGLTVCAERVAIQKAVSEGERQIIAVAIVAGETVAPPCGACLQVISEFAIDPDVSIISATESGEYSIHTLNEHLPMRFEL